MSRIYCFLAAILFLMLSSCKSEDQFLMNGTWKLQSARYEKEGATDVDSTFAFPGLSLSFREDGKLEYKTDAYTAEGTWVKRTTQKFKGVDQNGNSVYRGVSALLLTWKDTSGTEQTLFVDDLAVGKKEMEFARNYNGSNLEAATERLFFTFRK